MKHAWMSLRRVTVLLSIVLLMSVECCTKPAFDGPAVDDESSTDESVTGPVSERWRQGFQNIERDMGVLDERVGRMQDRLTKIYEMKAARDASSIGWNFATGNGVPKDMAKAVEWFQKAAVQGLAEAQYNLGVAYDKGAGVPKNTAQAVEWYEKAAVQGLAAAQYNLGVAYDEGAGVPKDTAQAVEWYEKAAAQGNAAAQFNLGVNYNEGDGVPKDVTKAVKWWQKAAEQGFAAAQYNLGVAYYEGFGVPKDFVLAYAWFNLAATHAGQTGANAKKYRDELEERLGAEQLAEGQRLSSNWKIGDLLQRFTP